MSELDEYRKKFAETGNKRLTTIRERLLEVKKPTIRLGQLKYELRYPEDIDRIVRVLAGAGISCSEDQALRLWTRRSDEMCASWLGLPSDDQILLTELLRELEPDEIVEGE